MMSAVETNSAKIVKAIVLTQTGSGSDYSNLKVRDEPYPSLEKSDQVLVRTKACGVNFAELMQRQGLYRPVTKTPYTPGYEASGVVEQVGADVADLKVGDRVLVFSASAMWKEVVILPRGNVIKMPESMSFEDGAALLVNYVTAYQVLFRMASIKPGDIVLIHMAAGGVGMAATQLCRTVPGVVVIGTASPAKHDAIRDNGVTHSIDYTSKDYVEEIKRLYPSGVDVVLDPLNGPDSIRGYQLLKPFGRIVHFGAASITKENRSLVNAFKAWWKCLSVNAFEIMEQNKSVSGYHLGYLFNHPDAQRQVLDDLRTLLDLYEQKKIIMRIDSTYSFSNVAEAFRRIHARQNVGKILLKPDAEFTEAEVSTDQVKLVTTVTSSVTERDEPVIVEVVDEAKTTTTASGDKDKSTAALSVHDPATSTTN